LTNVIESISLETDLSLKHIRQIKGATNISIEYPGYLTDESKLSGGYADVVYFPESEEEVAAIVRYCFKNRIPLTISGGRTGITGSAIPFGGALVVMENLRAMNGIGFDEERKKWFLEVMPAFTLKEISAKLQMKDIDSLENLTEGAKQIFKSSSSSFFYPVDPTELTATIGGTVATNASGARTFKYGSTREWIRMLRVVLFNGDIVEIERGQNFVGKNGDFCIKLKDREIQCRAPGYNMPDVKNAAGIYSAKNMDVIDIFIGAEGILGVITNVQIWLEEKFREISSILFFKCEKDAFKFVSLLKSDRVVFPEYIEYVDENGLELLIGTQRKKPSFLNMPDIPKAGAAVFFDLSYKTEEEIPEILTVISEIAEKCGTSAVNSFATCSDAEIERLRNFRHALPETVNNIISERKKSYPEIYKLGTDIAVPEENFNEMVAYYHELLQKASLDYVIFGHIGNSHLHVNILPKDPKELKKGKEIYAKFAKKAISLFGTVSAEHGIGKIKHQYLEIMFGKKGVDEMRTLKKCLDPRDVFNKNNMFS